MQTFLDEVSGTLLKNHGTDLIDVCVVLPNRRAGIFLKRALAKVAGKTIWSPDVYSIEDFLTEISGYSKTDQIALTFELYEIHRQIEKQDARDFEQFATWGQLMLADFNEIDMHLIDATQLYSYLNEVKALEKWNPDGRQLTTAEREYLAFFNSLGKYYQQLREKLILENTGYQGLIYRHAAENIQTIAENFRWKKIYFAGFNALTAAEERVIDHLRKNRAAAVVRDADAYYMEDLRQEAGEFLRKQRTREGSERFGPITNFFRDNKKHIEIFGIPRKEGQALKTGKIISDFKKETLPPNDTAIVLADESLLIPVLNNLPENTGAFNVTMGYPLRLTPPHAFIMLIFRMYENAGRFRKLEEKTGKGFYYRDILRLMQHSMFSSIFDAGKITGHINTSKQVFYQPDEIHTMFTGSPAYDLIHIIFASPEIHPVELTALIGRMTGFFREKFQKHIPINEKSREAMLHLEYLYHTNIIIKRIQELNALYDSIVSVRTLREIFRQLSGQIKLPFTGEPLKGIQIMGMLETRNLDFKRVILVAANEGILPASATGNSLIPYDIQVEMKMPTHNQKNAVFAYHFYRLLQRAEQVHILYNTEPDELGGGEKSRFIQQIINELPRYNPKVTITEKVESLPPPAELGDRVIEIPKNGKVFQSLMERAARGLSPTSLNQYRRCPLQFYFRNVAGLKETEEVEESMEFKTIGSIVHQVLEDLFKPLKGRIIRKEHIVEMKSKTRELTENAFQIHYSKGQMKFGKNRLIYEVIQNFIHSYLKYEEATLDSAEAENHLTTVLGLEEKMESENLGYLFPGLDKYEIKLLGVIDRLDKTGNITRIIDYKTGKVQPSELRIKEWEDLADGEKKEKVFQVMLYAWLFSRKQKGTAGPVNAGIISLPVLSHGFMKFELKESSSDPGDIDEDKLEAFETYLVGLLGEVFDRETPFVQTENRQTCRICDFKNICGR